MPEKLTAIIIAHKSEATITECVRALAFCDAVLVGEHESPDQTAALARQAGAEVLNVPWEGYGKTKNNLISRVKEGWILSVDADEIVTPALGEEIRQTVNRPAGPSGYWVSRRNHFLGREIRHCGWRPDWQLRLFRAGKGKFEERPVHEALRVDGPAGRLQNVLDHFSYRTVGDYLVRMNTYTSLAAQERHKKGKAFSHGRLLFDPGWTFIKMFGLKSGWRDGFPGLTLCLLSSLNTLVKHAKHWEIEKNKAK
jgi:glycosyltransferase involved in cell wall biosynthesis